MEPREGSGHLHLDLHLGGRARGTIYISMIRNNQIPSSYEGMRGGGGGGEGNREMISEKNCCMPHPLGGAKDVCYTQ